jgi:cell division septum initiation protein DivIVA
VKVADTLESLEASVAKVDALVQSVEQRQSQIEDAHQKAEAMLAEVNRIAEAMTFSDSLRDRINATVARTRRLRGENGK